MTPIVSHRLLTLMLLASTAHADTGQAIIDADQHPENWLSYGRTYSEQRFSPLDQINTRNAKNLKIAWYYDLDTNRGQEGTPLVVDGVMYATITSGALLTVIFVLFSINQMYT